MFTIFRTSTEPWILGVGLLVLVAFTAPAGAQLCLSADQPLEDWYPSHFHNYLNHDLRDFGVFFFEATDPVCSRTAATQMLAKIKATNDAIGPDCSQVGFLDWLGGVNVTLAVATALELGPLGELTEDPPPGFETDLEHELGRIFDCFTEANMEWANCDLENADTCMDDYAIAAAAFAWMAVYQKKNNRPIGDYADLAIYYLDQSFTTTESVCVRRLEGVGEWDLECLAVSSVAELRAVLDSGYAEVIQVNHDQESPPYIINLLASLASTVDALRRVGADWNPDELAILLGQELFKFAQDRVAAPPLVEYLATGCRRFSTQTWVHCGDWWVSATHGIPYQPDMVPVKDFLLDKFELASRPDLIDNGKYQFDAFNPSYFTYDHGFHHWGRMAVYDDMGWCWAYPDEAAGCDPPLLGGVSPHLWIDVPADHQAISGPVPFSGWAGDEVGVGLAGLAFEVDGQRIEAPGLVPIEGQDACDYLTAKYGWTDPNCPWVRWEFTFDPGPYGNGLHELTVIAIDAENGAQSMARSFDVVKGTFNGTSVEYLRPTDDAFVAEDRPETNYGTSNLLRVRSTDSGRGRRSYLKFDLSRIDGVITAATLRVANGPRWIERLYVWRVFDTSWDEHTITWKTAPVDGQLLSSASHLAPGSQIAIDVTGAVEGNRPFSLALTTREDLSQMYLYSKENPGAETLLEVQYLP